MTHGQPCTAAYNKATRTTSYSELMCLTYKVVVQLFQSVSHHTSVNQMSCGRQRHGIILIVLSGFFETFIGVLEQFPQNRSFLDIMGFSQIVKMLVLLPLFIFKNVKFNFKLRTNLLSFLHSLTGALADTILYYSYTLLSIGDVTAIYSTNSVFSSIISVFIFGRSFQWSIFVSSFLCVIGVITICQPHYLLTDDEQVSISYKGIAAALVASILDSLHFNLNNLLDNVNHLLLTIYITINMIFFWILYLICEQRLPVIGFEDCSWTNFYITAIGLDGLLCVLAITRGFQLVEAGPGSIASCSVIVFGYLFQLFIEDSQVRVKGIVGALLIIMAVLLSSWNIMHNKNSIQKHMTEDISQSTSIGFP
ncbi:solute carrier family 35 member G1-like [Tachypleus tridentatus]|uniref:solute carrier family 35 member G1-like n=1 Tax=Tachypleus tridentatus TaxID=6853 RepID=UPI003FD2638C